MEKIIKLFIIAMTMVATTASAFATSYQVKGQLVDSLFNEGEPYVTIRIYPNKKNAKPVKVGVTDENGRFAETLTSSGRYNITFTAIGRQETTMGFEVTDANPIADLGRIIIKDSEEMLDEVEVVARKPIIKAEPDKLVYDLSEDPATKSNTIIEMLRKVPMVTVDGDDNIKVNGSGDFKVYVNGRPDPMLSQNAKEVLKAMPASAIKKIEVITEPGAKYDAEGVGGILNLVTETRTSTDGFLANFTAAASNRDATGTVYARAKQGKVTLSANYSNIRQFENSHSNYGEREIFNSTTEHYNISNMNIDQHSQVHIGDLQLSFEADTLNLFTLSGNVVGVKGFGVIDGDFQALDIDRQRTWSYKSKIDADITYTTASANAAYQHTFRRPGHNIVLSYQYNYGKTGRDMTNDYFDFYNYSPLQNHRNEVTTPSNEHTIQLDYVNPFSQMHILETGAKYINRRSDNYSHYFMDNAGTFEQDFNRSVDLQQYQDVAALYASYTFNYKQFGFNAGLRYEHTRMGVDFMSDGYEDFSTTLDDLVPSAMVSYRLGVAGMLRLNYNRRITRPNVDSMNPYKDSTDPTNVQYGNPDLTSVENDQVTLSMSDFSHRIGYTLSLKYNQTSNMINQYTYMDNSVFYTTYHNFGSQKMTTLSGYATWTITPKIRLSINGAVNYTDYKDTEMHIANSGWSGNIGGDFNYDMPWKLRLNAYGGYGTQSISLQGRGTGWNYYGLSISRKFLKEDRLEVSINANQFLTPYVDYVTITETDVFRSEQVFRNKQWKVGISISYRLGGLKQDVKKASKSIINDDLIKSESSGTL